LNSKKYFLVRNFSQYLTLNSKIKKIGHSDHSFQQKPNFRLQTGLIPERFGEHGASCLFRVHMRVNLRKLVLRKTNLLHSVTL